MLPEIARCFEMRNEVEEEIEFETWEFAKEHDAISHYLFLIKDLFHASL